MNVDQLFKNALIAVCVLLLTACSKPIDTADRSDQKDLSVKFGPNAAGKVSFPVSCSLEAQSRFDQGLALMHHMMYVQAEKEFESIAENEPDCAMAQWGIAMTLFHPLWPGATGEAALKKGAAAVDKARSLNPPTDREQAYIDAVGAFYQNWDSKDHSNRIALWEKAQEGIYRQYPDDYEAAVLYALSHLATAPKTDRTFAHQKEAGALLEKLNKEKPGHPGVLHYTIHAYDNPMLASRAVSAAYAYDKIAPDVPHALHMPTHIFIRLGKWIEVIDLNGRSAKAALNYPANGLISHHYPHALDYKMYGYLQIGADVNAEEVLQEVNANQNYQKTFVTGYALAAIPARYYLERREWAKAAELEVRRPSSFPWEKFPEIEAMTYFARGLGAARNGDLAAAEKAFEKLDSLYERTVNESQKYWASQVDIQRKTVAAWIDFLKGRKEQAIVMMRKAADLEDSVDKHPVTPGAIIPARELLGDMLMESGKPADAMAEYERVLEISPNRFNSLYGAGYAAELAGKPDRAKFYYYTLIQISNKGKGNRPTIKKAKSFLAKG